MSKKTKFFIIYFVSWFSLSAVFICCAEIIGFFIFNGNNLIEHFLSSGHSLGVYRLFSYSSAALLAADISLRLLILFCNKSRFDLDIDIAIELIDDPTLQQIYLKNWVEK